MIYKMENLLKRCEKNMQELIQQFLRKLLEIWKRIFNANDCLDNINKLIKCTKDFFDDLVSESLDKKQEVETTIEELKAEAENLQRLLNVKLDLKIYDDLPLADVRMKLDVKLEELRKTLRLRREQIFDLLHEQNALCSELGEEPRSLVLDPLPSEDELDDFRRHLQDLLTEKNDRLYKISQLRREIRDLLRTLDIKLLDDRENHLLNDRDIKLNNETFRALHEMLNGYKTQVAELEESIELKLSRLITLWDRLNISPNTRKRFDRHTDKNQMTYNALCNEVDRCEDVQRQNIKKCVDTIRKEIMEWWELCMRSDSERKRFSHFYSDCYTEDLLYLHEMELKDIKSFYKKHEKIFELYENRQILWNRMIALEKKESEPGRYNNRGGQLLKEEKERKTITSRLPKIESQLTALVSQYVVTENSKFLIYGEDILEVLARDWEKKQIEKEKTTSTRKITRTPSNNRTPMSFRTGQTSMTSIRGTPSTNSAISTSHSIKVKVPVVANERKFNGTNLLRALESPGTTPLKKASVKSSTRKNRVIGTTIRRDSTKRRSITKRKRSLHQLGKRPRKIQCVDSSESENYELFENRIEPAAQSSVMVNSINMRSHWQQEKLKENVDVLNTYKERLPLQNNILPHICTSGNYHKPNLSSTSRKWTTKKSHIVSNTSQLSD